MRHLHTGLLALLSAAPVASAQLDIGPQTRVDLGRGEAPCNELSIAVSPASPLELVGSWNDYREGLVPRVGAALSFDGGVSWSDFLVRPPVPNQSSSGEGDPMTAFDPRTGTLWVGGLSWAADGGVFVARKAPGETLFQPSVMARIAPGVDKGWMTAGRLPDGPDTTRVYVAYNEGLIYSADMGDTWSFPKSLGFGIGFLPKIGPDGTLYVVYWDFQDGIWLRRSFNGGVVMSGPIRVATRLDWWSNGDSTHVPGTFRVALVNGMAVDPNDGTVYVVYADTTDVQGANFNVDLWFTRSVDQGATWSVPVVINGDSDPPGDQFFPWLEVDERGRLHLLSYDTREHPGQSDTAPAGLIDAYYSYSDDQGATWTEARLTPTSMDSSVSMNANFQFIGDYLGMAVTDGRAHPLYMATPNGNADVFTHVIEEAPVPGYCYGLGCPCANDHGAAGCGNAGLDGLATTGARLHADGSRAVAADDLSMTATGLAANAFGVLYAGQGQGSLPFGDGLRCILGAVYRYPVRAAGLGGILRYEAGELVSWANGHFGPGGQVQPGDTWNYQTWYRDPAGPCASTFNFTNALTVAWQ